jgi:hypothetical protein
VADTIEIDLATLEHVLKHGLDPGFHALQGCVAEISISPETLPTLARKFSASVASSGQVSLTRRMKLQYTLQRPRRSAP